MLFRSQAFAYKMRELRTQSPSMIGKDEEGKMSKPEDAIADVKSQTGAGAGEETPPAERSTSPQVGPTSSTAPARTGTNNEQRRVYGGKYIREGADAKLLRQFEHFINHVE